MPNWELINKARLRRGPMGSDDSYGMNGAFGFNMPGEPRMICVVASDQMGWKHVSVSFGQVSNKTPSWEIMCWVKDIFWDEEDAVIQIHPKKSDYVNYHKGCLHLWQCIDGREQPLPPSIFVGPKNILTQI